MDILPALTSGFVGASALTLVHEVARRIIPDAPRIDVLGMRAIAASIREVGYEPPPSDQLFQWALVGDMLSNSVYYSGVAIGQPQHALRRGALLGLAAGIGAVVVPPFLGFGTKPQARTPLTQGLTVAWYLLGGLAAGAMAQRLTPTSPQHGH